MSNPKEEAIEMCQKKMTEAITTEIDFNNRDLVLQRLYYNQCWMMHTLTIILEDMKD